MQGLGSALDSLLRYPCRPGTACPWYPEGQRQPHGGGPLLLKVFTLLVVASFGITLVIRSPRAKRVGWIVIGALVLLGLLAVQLLRTLDTMLR